MIGTWWWMTCSRVHVAMHVVGSSDRLIKQLCLGWELHASQKQNFCGTVKQYRVYRHVGSPFSENRKWRSLAWSTNLLYFVFRFCHVQAMLSLADSEYINFTMPQNACSWLPGVDTWLCAIGCSWKEYNNVWRFDHSGKCKFPLLVRFLNGWYVFYIAMNG